MYNINSKDVLFYFLDIMLLFISIILFNFIIIYRGLIVE